MSSGLAIQRTDHGDKLVAVVELVVIDDEGVGSLRASLDLEEVVVCSSVVFRHAVK
jgi:hypothetical protein